MAVQLHVAHSASVAGAGVIAGGPYYCAQGSVWTALYNCMTPSAWTPLPDSRALKSVGDFLEKAGKIDPTRNLSGAPVWLFSGARDRTVYSEVVMELRRYYELYGAKAVLVADRPAGHGMITAGSGGACAATQEPFINDCGYDAAGELLRHLLGPLNSPSGALAGRLLKFDQQPFGGNDISMDEAAYAFIPQSCASGACRIHVAFHGCRQDAASVGEKFVRDAGYNRWADANRLIVLYPQAIARYWPVFNPRACWDWWGYTSADYATREGAQIRAVKAMLDRLAQ